jgi:Holliday junction resolvase RusA-like endonuclease
MQPKAIALPLRFVVIGKPISHQTKDRAALGRWKAAVARTAKEVVSDRAPLGGLCKCNITHFYDTPDGNESGVPDSDNIVKPVRDALNGIIWHDDYQVSLFTSGRLDLNAHYKVRNMPAALANAFVEGKEFLYIMVESISDPTELPQ